MILCQDAAPCAFGVCGTSVILRPAFDCGIIVTVLSAQQFFPGSFRQSSQLIGYALMLLMMDFVKLNL